MRTLGLSSVALLLVAAGVGWTAKEPAKVVLACQIANVVSEKPAPEGNTEIVKALRDNPVISSTVYIYLHNYSPNPVTVKNVSWNGIDVNKRLGEPSYDVLWWRSTPETIAPGDETEITICLRESLQNDTEFTVNLGNAGNVQCTIRANNSGPRLSTVAFSQDLKIAYLYIDTQGAGVPREVYIDGKPAKKSAKTLGGKTMPGLAVIKITPSKPFCQGSRHLFRINVGKQSCAASIRALGDVATFGTYGVVDSKTYSSAGFDSNISFTTLDEKTLKDYEAVGLRAAMTIGFDRPAPYMVGNPAVYGYLAMDEPDCSDFSKDTKRPIHKRLGTMAQSLIEWGRSCEQADPVNPTLTTIDLTFAPQNYFAYAKVADIANPDCYTLVNGWPVTVFRDMMSIMKRASAPQPFLATYQGHWEETIKDISNKWMGSAEIEAIGSENMVDHTKLRGYGRAPSPEESRILMHYAIGSGAHGMFNYIVSTDACVNLLLHSTRALPEIWQAVTRTSRELRTIAPLIQISHSIEWCTADKSSLWVKTLVCGEDAALVVAVNEACKSEKESFISSPVRKSTFAFADMPWLQAVHVYRVGDGKLDLLESTRDGKVLKWGENSIADAQIYMICASDSLADNLVKTYFSAAPHATQEGMQSPPEGYLKGRRKSPQDR